MTTIASFRHKYPTLIKGTEYEHLDPLPDTFREDGKSMVNPSTGKLSVTYDLFPEPLLKGPTGAFDVHVYYFQERQVQKDFARSLWERIRRECPSLITKPTVPELKVHRLWDKPIGPHPMAMFEVNIFTPAQFGAFIPWLMMNRGPLSCLVHPNTGTIGTENELHDHTIGAAWIGEKVILDTSVLGPRD